MPWPLMMRIRRPISFVSSGLKPAAGSSSNRSFGCVIKRDTKTENTLLAVWECAGNDIPSMPKTKQVKHPIDVIAGLILL